MPNQQRPQRAQPDLAPSLLQALPSAGSPPPPTRTWRCVLCALLAGWLVLGSAAESHAEPARPLQLAPVELGHESYQLANGLRVILSQDRKLPRVAVNLWYHVGPVNEPPQRSGFAHLFEHLMFEGSKHVGRNFDQLMEGMGANNINGTTWWDRTNYFETVPSEHLATALWIESDRMAFMALTPERLEAQRAIVKNERRQSFENAPYGASNLALLNLLFPQGHPYHGAVIGSMEDLSRASMQDVHAFYTTYYAPNNATLTLVGNFDTNDTKALIERYFGSLPARPLENAERALTQPLSSPKHTSVTEEVELPRTAVAWLAPPAYTAADASLRVAMQILTGGKASRLYRRLVVEQRLATEVLGYVDANQLCSIVSLEVKGRSGVDPSHLERELAASLAELRGAPPTARELARAKRGLLVALIADLERLNSGSGDSGRAGLLQQFSYYKRDPGYLNDWIQALNGVSSQDVTRAASDWLKPQQAATVLTLPKAVAAGGASQ